MPETIKSKRDLMPFAIAVSFSVVQVLGEREGRPKDIFNIAMNKNPTRKRFSLGKWLRCFTDIIFICLNLSNRYSNPKRREGIEK
ncbi:hypothetical protein CASFOL_009607 [Castilleja foliolosa]|uniref:Uncharacterized protein n=1 Tax=Castilleja foliolosa TaxID=1961234 RepID=A0ABD3DWL5_9LAMI